MPVNRKRARRENKGAIPKWVKEYLKTGKEPEKGEPGYEQACDYFLLNLNVPGLPEKNPNGYWSKK
jgi:hypothetical protein